MHDTEPGIPENDSGDHLATRGYHQRNLGSAGGQVTDHGAALDSKDIPSPLPALGTRRGV